MIRSLIKIDEEKCNGCGLCADACHEGAIEMIDGKAKLTREDYCDGLGDCLPACPTGAISFEEREAPAYDEEAVKRARSSVAADTIRPSDTNKPKTSAPLPCGCPGTMTKSIKRPEQPVGADRIRPLIPQTKAASQLSQWPCQIKLVPVNAPYFEDANLLIAADCTAYAYGNFHNDFIRNHITLIGCPKLDMGDYTEKLTAIIKNNNIKSVKVVRMEVPCCGGIEAATKNALMASGKFIPWQVVTISTDGKILD
ncbi:MAG: 4Fe-4S binding protein [Clostridia bacterium]|nr:4Fe-4S binding protein [Clostridia bacterium]